MSGVITHLFFFFYQHLRVEKAGWAAMQKSDLCGMLKRETWWWWQKQTGVWSDGGLADWRKSWRSWQFKSTGPYFYLQRMRGVYNTVWIFGNVLTVDEITSFHSAAPYKPLVTTSLRRVLCSYTSHSFWSMNWASARAVQMGGLLNNWGSSLTKLWAIKTSHATLEGVW